MPSRASGVRVDRSNDTALKALRCSIGHGRPPAQLCSATSPPTTSTQSSNSVAATDSSIGCTGDRLVHAEPARERGGQRRFVELDHHRAFQPASDLRAMSSYSLGERSRQITHGAAIRDRPMPARQFQVRRERDRAGCLDLHGSVRSAQACLFPGLFERIDVLGEQADRTAGGGTAACGYSVTARHGVDRDIDEQRACPADEVRPDSAGGQLHQMRQSMKFTDDDFGGLAR